MEFQYLIDSNPIIDFFNRKLPLAGKNFMASIEPVISVITHIELLSNKKIPEEEWQQLQNFVQVAYVFSLNDDVVKQTIRLRQTYKLKTPDAIIAATALTHNLTLVSRNITDFKNITDLMVINPHTL